MSNQEIVELFNDIELSTQVEILERVLADKAPECVICGDDDLWDDRFCYYCAKEHYS